MKRLGTGHLFKVGTGILALALALLLSVALLPAGATAASTPITITGQLNLDGVSTPVGNLTTLGYRWDPSASPKTLTLANFSQNYASKDGFDVAITVPAGTVIYLQGSNTIKVTGPGIGIGGTGDLTIMPYPTASEAKLSLVAEWVGVMSGGNTDIIDVDIAAKVFGGSKYDSACFFVRDCLRINGARIDAQSDGVATLSWSDTHVTGDSYLNLVTTRAYTGNSQPFVMGSGGNMIISDGVISAKGPVGLFAAGDLEVYGGTLEVEATGLGAFTDRAGFYGGRTTLKVTSATGWALVAKKPYTFKEPKAYVWDATSPVRPTVERSIFFAPEAASYYTLTDAATPNVPARHISIDREYTVSMQNVGKGASTSSLGKAIPGAHITVSSSANKGNRFAGWHTASGGVTVTNNRFVMPPTNVILVATFEAKANPLSTHLKHNVGTRRFNNKQHTVTATQRAGTTGLGTPTVFYQGTKGTKYTRTSTAPKNIGTYAITANVTEGSHFVARSNIPLGEMKITPAKNKVSRVTAGSRQATVRWTRVSDAHKISRYQVRIRERGAKKWQAARTYPAKTNTATIRGLKSGKRYQVQVRSFKTVGGVRHYSPWSATKLSPSIKK